MNVSGQQLQEYLEYVGQSHDTYEGVPEDAMPDYSTFGAVGINDDDVPAEALADASAAKRIAMSGSTVKTIGSLPTLVVPSTDTYPALICASINRHSPRTVMVSADNSNSQYQATSHIWIIDVSQGSTYTLSLASWVSTPATPAGFVSIDASIPLWDGQKADFSLKHNASTIASAGLMDPEGNLSLVAVVNLTNGTDTFNVTYDGGRPQGTLKHSSISVIGLNNF